MSGPITIDLACWHDGCAHVFHLALQPEDVSANNEVLITHLVEEHGSAGLVRP